MSTEAESWKIEAAAQVTAERDALLRKRKSIIEENQKALRQVDDKLSDLSTSARALSLPVSWLPDETNLTLFETSNVIIRRTHGFPKKITSRKPFKERTLELLSDAYPEPLKASEIQSKIQKENEATYHDKTAGMSLYRLSKDGLVERRGKDLWYYVPTEQRLLQRNNDTENENPELGGKPSGSGVFD